MILTFFQIEMSDLSHFIKEIFSKLQIIFPYKGRGGWEKIFTTCPIEKPTV